MKLPERKGIVKPEWADELEKGLKLLWDGVSSRDGKQSSICFTISYDTLRYEIASRIHGYVFFREWFTDNNACDSSFIRIQAARKAWMLDMIEEFRGN